GRGSAAPADPDDKTILHVLNRLGFGARPGDLERVRQLGLAAYIDQQLHPEGLADTQMAARLAGFQTLGLSSRAIAQDYYLPAQMARKEAQLAKKDATSDPNAADTAKQTRTSEQLEIARKERAVVDGVDDD